MPGTPVFARLVPLGEMAGGLALLGSLLGLAVGGGRLPLSLKR